MKYILFCIFCGLLIGCTSDRIIDLGNGYKYRDEGGDVNDIFCEYNDGGFVPANVVDYAYDDAFIIARQRPKLPSNPLYDITYCYPENISDFYWIVLKNKHIVLGPLVLCDYLQEKQRLNICLELD